MTSANSLAEPIRHAGIAGNRLFPEMAEGTGGRSNYFGDLELPGEYLPLMDSSSPT